MRSMVAILAILFVLQQERRVPSPAPVPPAKEASSASSTFALEIPAVGLQMEGDTAASIPHTDFDRFRIRIRRQPTQVTYGNIFAKVNTESANIVMTTSSTADGIVCDFDLTRRAGFRFQPGRNSVEIEIKDRSMRRFYSSFLVQTAAAGQDSLVASTGAVESVGGQKYAVIVGVSRYEHAAEGIPDLRFADRDAAAFRDFLTSAAGGSFSSDNLVFLVNEAATSQNVRTALFTFLTRAQPDDLVVIFFASHGAPDPNDRRNLYLLTYDTRAQDMGGTAIPMWQLQDVLSRVIKARRAVFFTDACHSEGIGGGVFGAPRQNNLVNQYLARYTADAQHALMTASDISESSFEDERWGGGHGVFTYFLLQGLGGAADGDKDGVVTAGELFPYVRAAVRKATGGRQNPTALPGLAERLALARRR